MTPTPKRKGRPRDPRTERGEIEAALEALPNARLLLLDTGHAPHAGRLAEEATEGAVDFLEGTLLAPPPGGAARGR